MSLVDLRHGNVFKVIVVLTLHGCGPGGFNNKIWSGGANTQSLISKIEVKDEYLPLATDPRHAALLAAADTRAAGLHATAASAAVSGTVTFRKDNIFNREFLYGCDLQYSSHSDPGHELIPQATAIGHVPAFFRRVGSDLQLVADQRRLFESDINHPEQLLATYAILSETEATLTVKFASGGLVLNQLANASAPDQAPEPPQQIWVRSLEFVEDGNILLQETALMLKNGDVQTYMESVFPRSSLVPTDYKGLEAHSNVEPLAGRYRFISAETIYVNKADADGEKRSKTSFAARFYLGEQGTVDFYVTPNIPEKFLPVIRSGVEGWNRYFEPQLGRQVTRFRGHLPAGIKLGDPRYNIINFDSVAEAGAAYESAATDPFTGIQSHALIYLPKAWYNIGAKMWRERTAAPAPSATQLRATLEPKGRAALFEKSRQIIACVESAENVAMPADVLKTALAAAPALVRDDSPLPASVDDFSMRLMTSTLFHEVGHALGLAHNFKGSLAFDPNDPARETKPTTWSIMDYNYYQNEQGLFTTVGGAAGPSLEYDRQIISQLYHGGRDVQSTDMVVPACDDTEADATDGGVDPLCVRYDAEKDPSLGVAHALHNVVESSPAAGVERQTLTESLLGLQDRLTAIFRSEKEVATPVALQAAAAKYGDLVGSLADYYLASGAQSVRGNLLNGRKALRIWRDDVKIDEAAFRGRYLQTLTTAMALEALPEAPRTASANLATAVESAAKANTAIGATAEERATNAAKAAAEFQAHFDAKVLASLMKLRTDVYEVLKSDLKNPLALAMSSGGSLSHFDEILPKILSAGALRGFGDSRYNGLNVQAERLAAGAALATYNDSPALLDDVKAKLNAVITSGSQAGDTRTVTAARLVLKSLGT